eukprot:m.10350 g.10350  ORF g.10350 m.10350 type:complete len:409 (+) comp6578_c0_seq1:25-1251(+)
MSEKQQQFVQQQPAQQQPPMYNQQPPMYNQQQQQQPGYNQQQPQPQYPPQQIPQPVVWQPGPLQNDNLLMQKLQHAKNIDISQGNTFLEGISTATNVDCFPNIYIVGDLDRPMQIIGSPNGETAATPLFFVQETSGCCARCCCPGHQSMMLEVKHAKPEVHYGLKVCGVYNGHKYIPDESLPTAMTVERPGWSCTHWNNCCVCCECCQDEMLFYNGPPREGQKPGWSKENGGYFGRSVMPLYGGCFTPTLHMEASPPNEKGQYPGQHVPPFGKMEGPCFFGGFLGMFCPTFFDISMFDSNKREADIGFLKKRHAETCSEMCAAMCTKVDFYDLSFKADEFSQLTPEQKATVLGTALHLDYKIFESDKNPIEVDGNGNSTTVTCTFFNWYCMGEVIPCCIAFSSNNDGG